MKVNAFILIKFVTELKTVLMDLTREDIAGLVPTKASILMEFFHQELIAFVKVDTRSTLSRKSVK